MGVTGPRTEGVVLWNVGVDWPLGVWAASKHRITLPQSGCQGLGSARQHLLFLGPEAACPISLPHGASSPHLSPMRTLSCWDKASLHQCDCTLTYNVITSAKILFLNKVTIAGAGG